MIEQKPKRIPPKDPKYANASENVICRIAGDMTNLHTGYVLLTQGTWVVTTSREVNPVVLEWWPMPKHNSGIKV